MREDRLALDHARIAEGRFLGRAAPVDQHHLAPALLQMQCDAHAHHAGPENNELRFHDCSTHLPMTPDGNPGSPATPPQRRLAVGQGAAVVAR